MTNENKIVALFETMDWEDQLFLIGRLMAVAERNQDNVVTCPSMELISNLEDHACNLERIHCLVGIVNDTLWDIINDGDTSEAINRAGLVTETLMELIPLRQKELDHAIKNNMKPKKYFRFPADKR